MSLLELFQWIQYSTPLTVMRASPWFFPMVASIHLLGLALLGGTVLVVDLRLLGLGLSRQPVAVVARDAERWLITSLAVMLPTGILLFMCFATKYYYLTAFWVKLASLVLVLAFTFVVRRPLIMSDEGNLGGIRGKLLAVVSLALWTTVALGGRLIGFP
jgi:hypothetical protein